MNKLAWAAEPRVTPKKEQGLAQGRRPVVKGKFGGRRRVGYLIEARRAPRETRSPEDQMDAAVRDGPIETGRIEAGLPGVAA